MTRLAAGGIRLPPLGLGTAPIGGLFEPVDEQTSYDVIHAALDSGLTYFDTAPLYGRGLAEERIGRALAAVPRQRYILSTKAGYAIDEESVAGRVPMNLGYDAAMRSMEASLRRLNVDHVDIGFVHDPDDFLDHALAGAYEALRRLREEGVVHAVGVGTNRPAALVAFVERAEIDVALLAGRYTLLDRSGEAALDLCAEHGVAVVAGGVFNSGVLADPDHSPFFDYQAADARIVESARRIRAVCERHGVPLTVAAIQFPRRHPAVVAVLVGCRSVDEVTQHADGFTRAVPDALWGDVDRAR